MQTSISDKSYSSDPVFQTLRDRIVSGVYPPGTLLVEKVLTGEFGVSRTPYREALRQLESLKLVKVIPRFGTYVSEININEVVCAYEVRLRLESMAAELSAERRTEGDLHDLAELVESLRQLRHAEDITLWGKVDGTLHAFICKTSKNIVLVETIENLRLMCARVWTSSWRENYDFEKLIAHWTLVQKCIEAKDGRGAAAAMAEHLQDSIDMFKKNIFSQF